MNKNRNKAFLYFIPVATYFKQFNHQYPFEKDINRQLFSTLYLYQLHSLLYMRLA